MFDVRTCEPNVIQKHDCLIRRDGIFCFSRRAPADVRSRFKKDRVIVSLHTRSLRKAQRSAAALSERLERYWDSIRLEVFHTKEPGLSLVQEVEADRSGVSASIRDALDSDLRLKVAGRSKTVCQGDRACGGVSDGRNGWQYLTVLNPADPSLGCDAFSTHMPGRAHRPGCL